MTTRMARLAAATMLAFALAAPHALAQASPSLDRRASVPLVEMGRVTRLLCDGGNERACAINARLRRAAIGMLAAQQACAKGSPRACKLFEVGVVELARAYRRFAQAARASGGAKLPDDPLSGELFGEDGVFGKTDRKAE